MEKLTLCRIHLNYFEEDAKKYGYECAILLYHIAFWIQKNKRAEKGKKSGRHYHDDHWWMFDSIRKFQKKFPFLSRSAVDRMLKKLVDKKVLLRDNKKYNKMGYDRTGWYSLKDEKYLDHFS